MGTLPDGRSIRGAVVQGLHDDVLTCDDGRFLPHLGIDVGLDGRNRLGDTQDSAPSDRVAFCLRVGVGLGLRGDLDAAGDLDVCMVANRGADARIDVGRSNAPRAGCEKAPGRRDAVHVRRGRGISQHVEAARDDLRV